MPYDSDYTQAMVVVDYVLKAMSEEPEMILDFLNLPANLLIVSSEFDAIRQRWLDEEM